MSPRLCDCYWKTSRSYGNHSLEVAVASSRRWFSSAQREKRRTEKRRETWCAALLPYLFLQIFKTLFNKESERRQVAIFAKFISVQTQANTHDTRTHGDGTQNTQNTQHGNPPLHRMFKLVNNRIQIINKSFLSSLGSQGDRSSAIVVDIRPSKISSAGFIRPETRQSGNL